MSFLKKLFRPKHHFPHECFYCRHFQMRQKVPHMRVCRYPGPIKVEGGICQMWELEPNPKKRRRSVVQWISVSHAKNCVPK